MSTIFMVKILISITSYYSNKQRFLGPILANYTGSMFSNYEVTVALATAYSSSYPNVVMVPTTMTGSAHCWNNKEYLSQSYSNYDIIAEADDDIQIVPANIEYYISSSLPPTQIAGFLTMEQSGSNVQLISCPKLFGSPFISGSYTPRMLHSAAFIVDKVRYEQFLKVNIPHKYNNYDEQMMARSGIYTHGFTKIVSADGIKSGGALLVHLPCNYMNKLKIGGVKFHTPESVVS